MALCFCLGVSRAFASHTSPKLTEKAWETNAQGLGKYFYSGSLTADLALATRHRSMAIAYVRSLLCWKLSPVGG